VTTGFVFYRDGSFIQHGNKACTGDYDGTVLFDVAQLVNLWNG